MSHNETTLNYLARLLRNGLVTFMSMATIVFFVPRVLPGNPLNALVDADTSFILDETDRVNLSNYYGLDRPLASQYASYVKGIFSGDLGWSISRKEPVIKIVREHLPWTMTLILPSVVISTIAGFVLGVNAAWRRGQWFDRFSAVWSGFARSIPEYALAYVLLLIGCLGLGWFPTAGAYTAFTQENSILYRVQDIFVHSVLPCLSLIISLLGAKFLIARNSMIAAVGQDYVLLARAKGLSTRRVKYHHAARNAWAPFLAQFAIQLGVAVGGAIFVETVFNYPGLGSLVLSAVNARDYPLLEGCFLTLGVVVLMSNLVADIVIRRIDPSKAM